MRLKLFLSNYKYSKNNVYENINTKYIVMAFCNLQGENENMKL